MDKQIVDQKLESLRRCIERIQDKLPISAKNLATDFDKQDIVSLNLSRAVQLTVDIGVHIISGLSSPVPDTMGQTFDVLADMHVIPKELATQLKNLDISWNDLKMVIKCLQQTLFTYSAKMVRDQLHPS